MSGAVCQATVIAVLTLSSADVKNDRNYTSTVTCAFKMCAGATLLFVYTPNVNGPFTRIVKR
jgi:hypothetical protein